LLNSVVQRALAIAGGLLLMQVAAPAQPRPEQLPEIPVTASRLGDGIVGASTTVITREDLERAPQNSLADILSREAGVQTSSFYGGVNGVGTTIDLRGFGVTGSNNTLILINGRRVNDWDLPNFDLSTIGRDSIERIEITRGNSGAVLYGDGAVGGVINIITRSAGPRPASGRVEAGLGALQSKEANVAANASSGPFSVAVSGTNVESEGWRRNNAVHQRSGVADLRYTVDNGSIFLNLAGDNQSVRLPGERNISPTLGIDELNTDPRGTSKPLDFARRQGMAATGGVTRILWPGVELIVDGGIRDKQQQASFFAPFAQAFVDTSLTVKSVTPRFIVDQPLFGLPSKIITGIDVYDTDYKSDRPLFYGLPPIHVYTAGLTTTAAYWQQTVGILPTTDVSFGGRIQRNETFARDVYNPAAPQNFANPQGLPLDSTETQRAYHLGVEHRLNGNFAVFGRMAQAFRVPNIDERVGMSPVLTVTNFALRTQRSRDIEGGFRYRYGTFNMQASMYDMWLENELHFNPVTGANVNLDPTRRYGTELIGSWQATPDIRLKANWAYTRSVFAEGPFAGNDVPVVSRYTASAGVAVNIWQRYLMLDVNMRHVGRRFLDGNENNMGPSVFYMIPSHTLWDTGLRGEYQKMFWSFTVQNLFDVKYYDYALDTSFPPFFFNYAFYPQPGRLFMARVGMNFGP
jgi:iron complex outermembrane receptor protein